MENILHCNAIDPFVTLMGNFNWGPISCNDIVSTCRHAPKNADDMANSVGLYETT